MKKIAIVLIACWVVFQVGAAEPQWLTDMSKAQAQAKDGNKMVLMEFTGSDWRPWCIKFEKEVLDTQEFKDYAAKNLVLVKVDFPRRPKQSAEQKQTNKQLQDKYNVEKYPTFILVNPDGKEIGKQVGYSRGGPKAFIKKIEEFRKQG